MYLEFKDTYKYHNGHSEPWLNAVDMLNEYIQQHRRESVEVLSYNTVYLPDKQITQTCILAHAIEPLKR